VPERAPGFPRRDDAIGAHILERVGVEASEMAAIADAATPEFDLIYEMS
jgi:hypothetical protein